MLQKIAEGEFGFPLFLHFRVGILPFGILYPDRIFIELFAEVIRDSCVQADLAVGDELLQRVVDAEHLRDGRQVIESIRRDRRALALRDRCAVLIIGIEAPPRVLIYQPAMPDHRKLRACKSVPDIRFDDIRDQTCRVFGNACLFECPGKDLGIGGIDADLLPGSDREDIRDLHTAHPVRRYGGIIYLVDFSRLHAGSVDRHFIYIEAERSDPFRRDHIELPLSVAALKSRHTVHGETVVRRALPVRERSGELPAVIRQLLYLRGVNAAALCGAGLCAAILCAARLCFVARLDAVLLAVALLAAILHAVALYTGFFPGNCSSAPASGEQERKRDCRAEHYSQ